MKGSEKRKVRIGLILYCLVVFAVMLYSLFQPGTETVERANFGVLAEETFELTDESFVQLEFTVPQDNLTGISIGYDANEQIYQEEYLEVSIYRDRSTLLQKTEVSLGTQKGNCEIYIPTEFQVGKGAQLTVCIQSSGLEESGILLGMSEGREINSILKIDGEQQNKSLYASLLYYKLLKEPAKIVLAFIAEILAGLLVYYIAVIEKLPLISRRRKTIKQTKPKTRKTRKQMISLVLGYLLLALGVGLVLEYTYHFAVADASDENSYSVISEKTGRSVPVALREGSQMTQSFVCDTENFSGFGFSTGKLSGKKGKLLVQVLDGDTGEVLTEASGKISKLKKITKLVEKKEKSDPEKKEAEEKLLKEYVGLEFEDTIKEALGRTFIIKMSVSQTEDGELVFWGNEKSDNLEDAMLEEDAVGCGLCLVSFYKPYLCLKVMYLIFGILLAVALSFVYWVIFWKKGSLETVFLAAVYAMGIFYLLMITVYGVPDETAHIDTVYRISNEMMGIGVAQGPNQIYKRLSDIEVDDVGKADVTPDRYKELYDTLMTRCEDSTLTVTYGANTLANSTKWNYLPAAFGFTLARLLNLGFMPMVLLGRLFNLLVAGILMYFAIRKMPFGKTVFAVVGLLPITLQQIASCSYDAVLLGAAFLFAGYCLYLAYGERRGSMLDYIVLIITTVLIAACKGGAYLPYICLCLLIPFAKKRVNVHWGIALGGMLGLILLVFVRQYASKMFDIVTAVQGNVYGRVENVELYSFSYFLANPVEFIRIFENTFVALGEYYLSQISGGLLGKLNIKVSWVINVGFLFLMFLAALRRPEDKQYIGTGAKWFMGILCLGSLGLVALSMLVSWTPFGDKAILGIQGRYFLPFFGIAVLLLRNSSITFKGKSSTALIFAVCLLNMCVFSQILLVVLA